ncbi:MAG: serine/threonine-protein kinase [Acidobacteriota bacterium]|nr:serine/threonine-protein kinase [Acidobacteriota bacterium]
MTARRELQLRELLEGALDLAPPDRHRFLHDHAPDAELAMEAEALLATEDELSSVLDQAAHELMGLTPGGDIVPEAPEPELGQRIGPYELLQVLGEGGMGRVYLARQTGEVERDVALKLVRSGWGSGDADRRFLAERRALARLNHPNVAQLYDAATTPEGQPYFAMEYVDGIPITRYCEEQRLSLDQRLRLFAAVCRGVQHAHSKQLLHRDLKPSNILVAAVDGTPTPKIIDFGIVRWLDGGPGGEPVSSGEVPLGTPQYMSPEALRSSAETPDLDTRTDVYSLGVVLYVLLTGTHPHTQVDGGEEESPGQLPLGLPSESPRRPSERVADLGPALRRQVAERRRVRPGQLPRWLRGDLDCIVCKAIAWDREERYGTAEELANDLERSLRYEPVSARPRSLKDRFVKLTRRNRLATALVVLTLLTFAGAAIFSSLATRRALKAEERARTEAQAAQQALGFLVELFEAARPEATQGEEMTARELVAEGVERTRDQPLQPLQQAQLLHTLSDVYLRLGLYDEGAELAAEALELREKELPHQDPDTVRSLLLLGNHKRRAGDLDAAAVVLLRAEALVRDWADTRPLIQAEVHNSLGNLRLRQRRYDEAAVAHRRALELRQAHLEADHPDVAASHNNLGAVLWLDGHYRESEPHLRRASEIIEKNLGPYHPQLAASLSNLGVVLQRTGRFAESEISMRRVLEIQQRVLGPDHPETALTLTNLAILFSYTGRYPEAEELFQQALEIDLATVGESHHETMKVFSSLGLLYWRQGRNEEAEASYRRALALRRQHRPDDVEGLERTRMNLALVLRDTGRLEEALTMLEEVLRSHRANLGEDHLSTLLTLGFTGTIHAREGRLEQAEPMLRRSLAGLEQAGHQNLFPLSEILSELAAVRQRRGDAAEATVLYRRSLDLRSQFLPPGHPQIEQLQAALQDLRADSR